MPDWFIYWPIVHIAVCLAFLAWMLWQAGHAPYDPWDGEL